MASRGDVAVTGLGLVTPAGNDPETFHQTMSAGRSLASTDPSFAGLPVDFSCRVTDFDPAAELGDRLAGRLDRFAHLGLAAARRALADADLSLPLTGADRVAVVLGVGCNSLEHYVREFGRLHEDRPTKVSPLALARSVPNMVAGEIALDTGARGPNFTVSTACASGATAIGTARDLLLSGACDIVVTGGSESGISRMASTGFSQMRALSTWTDRPEHASRPFDTERNGFVLGEGAAVLVLERREHALARRARVRAWLRGYGASADAHHPTSPHPEGAGVEQAARAALADAGFSPRHIGHHNAHGTSTPAGDKAEAMAVLRLFDGTPPPVTAPKSILGHSLGAAGAIEAALSILALQHQQVPPTANLQQQDSGRELDVVTRTPRTLAHEHALSTSCGFGGQNAALVFSAA
ncbi:beta-ketoacyl-[acyl-carrier-protein] synthase family protein [Streptomyces sp. NPDC087440]|uniref:beta-ketoacyl-[acyl-carrier-protein] synthase family protein n=1 Tax=Streptomyces sp. NPDC087440 TaxID=3365790 RepID=UPI0037F4B2E1